jgi:hypothetical protein
MSVNQEEFGMKYLLATSVLFGAVVFGWPLLREDTGNECAAVENWTFRAAMTMTPGAQADPAWSVVSAMKEVLLQGTHGTLAKTIVEKKYPELPPQIGCTVTYWLDAPAVARQMEQEKARQEDAAHRMFERAEDAQRAMRALSSPAAPPPAKSDQAPSPSYKPPERRDMDRLIENTR